jgi:regulator of sigma E protease
MLVAVHEFGHYWVAKKLGFKVLRFSIGFGKPAPDCGSAATPTAPNTASAIPLGGYVKLLDEREGEVAPRSCIAPSRAGPSRIASRCCWRAPP